MYLEPIKTLHLELSNHCNAKCPLCARNTSQGEVNPNLKLNSWSKLDIENFLSHEFIKNLDRLLLCGNFGDPLSAREIIEIIEYFRCLNSHLQISINTNGGLRNSQLWKTLGGLGCRVVFSIDGLEDTNHIYRVGVSWKKLMENVSAYTGAGGAAEWHFIVFKHNEHQVREAKKIATDLGFVKFQVKTSSRFTTRSENLSNTIKIEPPSSIEFIHKDQNKAGALYKNKIDLNRYFDGVDIDCRVLKESSIYISADYYVFPCCWIGQEPWVKSQTEVDVGSFEFELKKRGFDLKMCNLKYHNIDTILKGPIISSLIPTSWNKNSLKDGKLKTCAKTCGKEFDLFGKQFL